ncbi:hypothetical protein [Ruminococcus callidus]|uniref:hypothetical protein n=1 Tax=Ruminococcus callidus TaxID=40519 RepID=UPI0035218683
MKIQYNGSSKILKRLVELVNRSQNVALRQDNTDKNTLYWTGLDGVEITVNIPSGAVEVDTELSETSTNPVENQAITKELAQKADKSAIPTVGDGVLSVQRNGKIVGTFSANATEDASINIPVPEKVSELENDAGYGTYTKPTTGIPKSDLASSVQASLGKADTALQKHQDISGKLDKTGDASNTTVTFSAASARENVKTGEKLSVILGKIAKWFADLKTVAFTGSYNDLANKPTIPDGSKYLPLAGGVMTGDIDLASNGVDLLVGSQRATQTTYATAVAGATISTKQTFSSGLPERKSLVGSFLDQNSVWHSIISVRHRNGYNDGVNYGMYLRSLLTSDGSLFWNKQTGAGKWQGERVLLDSTNYSSYAAKSDHTHDAITNSSRWASGANNAAQWVRLGTVVSSGNFATTVISVWSGDGANGNASQNSWFDIHIKDGWQSTESATKACGVTVYRTRCGMVKVKVIPTAHNTYTVWVYLPWTYWNGNYSVHGKYSSWTPQVLKQTAEPDGTAADTAYYDQAFLTSTVAAAKTLTDSGWVAMTVEGYAKSGTVKYRTYGKQITITGRSVVLKTDIATSYPAPQYIASTTFDFSKIVGCSGVGRSSSGVGAYVAVENYNGDNLVSVYALGSKIAAGSTLYFTITGFID